MTTISRTMHSFPLPRPSVRRDGWPIVSEPFVVQNVFQLDLAGAEKSFAFSVLPAPAAAPETITIALEAKGDTYEGTGDGQGYKYHVVLRNNVLGGISFYHGVVSRANFGEDDDQESFTLIDEGTGDPPPNC